MANTFKNFLSKSVGTSPATIYTCPSATQTTVIGLSVANITASPITADVYLTSSAVDYYLIKSGVVPVGGALVVVGGDQKVVTSAATSGDVIASVLEIS